MMRWLSLSLGFLVLGIASIRGDEAGQAEEARRPNIVWLLSEDNSKHWLDTFDPDGAPTPNISALAKDGLLFRHAFSNAPVCSVARTTLMTGCYAPRIGTQFHRKSVIVPMPPGLRMFPAYLRDAGYYTSNRQKKDYNAVEGDGVWDESSRRASWRKRKPGQPFFHMQSFGASHEGKLHFSKRKMLSEPTVTDPKSVKLAPYHPDTQTFRYTYARYHDRIRDIDREIGAVVEELRKDGLLEDTFILYFGDHGGVLPRGKGYIYESGLHVPLVVRVPENFLALAPAPRGTKLDGFVSFVDFGATALALAGLDTPEPMDGRAFLGRGLARDELEARNETIGYADRFDEKFDLVRSLRRGRFKYLRSYQPFNFDGLQNNYRYKMLAYEEWRTLYEAGKLNAVQRAFFERRAPEALYDVEADPHETRNLADDPRHRGTLLALRTQLSERVKSLPDLSFFPESDLVERGFENPVPFGEKERARIAKLVDIADLSLDPFEKARPAIERALADTDPWARYWALITCSSHGEAAKPLVDRARKLARDDPEALVRVRAAEFLGPLAAADPRPILMAALEGTRSGSEASLILNTLVLLRDGQPGYEFQIDPTKLAPEVRKYNDVDRRLQYLVK